MSNLVVLALDLAKRRTGWAVGSPDMKRPMWGVYETQEWDRQQGKRLHEWRQFLQRKITEHGVTYIAFEHLIIPPKEFNHESHVPMAQMHGIALEVAEELKLRTGSVTVQAWRKAFLGSAVAPKHLASKDRTPWLKDAAMKQAASRGWLPQYHDEAEALGIMDFALSCLSASYDHKTGPAVRRAELKAEIAAFRGEAA